MTPGLAGPPFPSGAVKGAIVAVASLEKPSVPMVVGICEIDVAALQEVRGVKGHAVKSSHWAGDEVWAWSLSGKPGGDAPEHTEGWVVDEISINEGAKNLSIDNGEDDSTGGIPINTDSEQKSQDEPHNPYVEGEEVEVYDQVNVEEKELSTKGKRFTSK